MANVDQRKYLKKYLDDDDVKRHKKKSREHSSSRSERVRIVDDDGEYKPKRKYNDENDFILTGEDAPQVVGIVDDRPPELRAIEDFRNSSKWRSLETSGDKSRVGNRLDGNSQKYAERRKSRSRSPVKRDYSPPRRPERREAPQALGARKRRSSDDYSPVRRKPEAESRYREVSGQRDLSPVRKRNNDTELSPVRKNRKTDQKDSSPIRRRKPNNDDQSPIRRRDKADSDQKDLSPPRTKKATSGDDQSPTRRRKRSASPNSSTDVKSRTRKSRFNSPETSTRTRKSRFDSPSNDESKIQKTLDGKLAGLQDAKMLKKETEEFRRREDDLFKKMSSDVSGRNADVVVRDKKSGRVRDLEEDRAKDEEKQQREKERQEIYNKWGKGLKQVEDYRNQVADDQYEGNKPLARYSDDVDLDKMLRDQERDGDPMLNYMRQKSTKTSSNGPKIPTYNGPYPDNRFNIRPGYRWDGVDRSNGYEKKWLTVQNQKSAVREEAYRYSTEDM